MKRLSVEMEPVIKRARLLDSSLPSSIAIDENDESISSQIGNTITLISDDELTSIFDDSEIIEEEEEEDNNNELIDLTEDESNSSCSLSNKHELKSSIDIEECPICLENLFDLQSIGVHLIITECHHVICTLCSDQLLSTSSQCPLCRKNISSTTLTPFCILT
jgi:hypothetical protein